ncbi:MAG: CDP-alcohol phosphatidyltransferase family protein [Planctomycetaceae bacterium]
MPSIYDLKSRFQALLRPVVGGLARRGVTANQVTVAAAALSFAAGGAIALWPEARSPLLLLPGVLFVRMALNAIDGMLAREHGMQSNLGAVLNELGDVLSDAALYLPLALVPAMDARLVVPVVVLAVIAEMAGVVAVPIGASRRYDGPLGKSDRAFAFGLICLLLGCGVPAGHWQNLMLWVMLAGLVLTIVNRARRGVKEAGTRC